MPETRSSRSPDDLPHDAIEQLDRIQFELDELKGKLEISESRSRRDPSAARTSAAVKALLSARRQREAIFGADIFADPAWDIFLELYAASLAQRRVPTSELCNSASVPPSTASRWIEKLNRQGWLERRADPLDARRIFVELTAKGLAAMERYFNEVGLEVGGV
jgi:DNA-binding MarR family transcriptional regulator